MADLCRGNAVHGHGGRHRHLERLASGVVPDSGLRMLAMLVLFWFRTVIGENQHGIYNIAVDRSFRMGMMWFIFSEVMFFAAFFGALFYARNLSVPWLAGDGVKVFTKLLLWNDYTGVWPTNGPAALGPRANGTFETIPALGLPAINTAILLSSSVTVTIAHHALITGHRTRLKIFLAMTFLLGFTFVGLQAHGISRGLHGARPAARHRHLRLDLLHADRISRPARHRRRHHADRHLVPGDERPFHSAAAFRLRSRGLVLAFRRRGVARAVYLRLLAVGAGAALPGDASAVLRIDPAAVVGDDQQQRTDPPTGRCARPMP